MQQARHLKDKDPEQPPEITRPSEWFPEIWRRIGKLEAQIASLPRIKTMQYIIAGLILLDIALGHRSALGDTVLNRALDFVFSLLGRFPILGG